MKTLYKFLPFVLLFSTLSCSLDEKPYGFYSEDNFYKTEGDAEAALYYAYDILTYLEYSRAYFYLGDLPTEECITKADEGIDNQNLHKWNVSSFDTNSTLTKFFKYAFIAINRASVIIENIPNGTYDQSKKDVFMGEAHFLRAWNYFNLVRAFGLVPMHKTSVSSLDETNAPLAKNLDEIYDFIISDCNQALKLLKVNQVLGRVDKVAVQSLLAKVYLTIASSKEHNVSLYTQMDKDVNTMYQLAASSANEVLKNQSVYGFEDNLLNIYDVEKPLGKENIFLLSMDRTGTNEGDYSKISKLFIPYYDGATMYIKNTDNTFTKTHQGWAVLGTNMNFYNTFDSADKRRTILYVTTVYKEDGTTVAAEYKPDGTGKLPWPFSRKYIDDKFIADKTSTKPFLIRYSDVALIYAEAAGPTTEAYGYLNKIRNRAGLADAPAGLDLNAFRELILNERSWELNLEGNRLYDLRRFNKVIEKIPNAATAGISNDQANFYPIPKQERELNPDL